MAATTALWADENYELAAITDPVERSRRADELRQAHVDRTAELADMRADALREARASGLSVVEISERLGITRQQVHRLLNRS